MIFRNSHWCKSPGDRKIELIEWKGQISDTILWIGGVHGDEPEGVILTQSAVEWFENWGMPYHTWIFIPCLNPDGLSSNSRTNANKVDLNRNFPDKTWSPHYQKERYHPGPCPASEPEVRGVVNLITQRRPKVIVHVHSWNPCIVRTGDNDFGFSKIFSRHTGYPFKNHIGYDTPGSLGEYGWRVHGIPVICVEIQEKATTIQIQDLFKAAMGEIHSGCIPSES